MTFPRATLAFALAALAAALPATAQAPSDVLPEDTGKALVVSACTACHQAELVVAKRRTADEWDEMIGKMVDRGATLTEEQQDEVFAYLVKHFGPEGAPAATPAEPPKGR